MEHHIAGDRSAVWHIWHWLAHVHHHHVRAHGMDVDVAEILRIEEDRVGRGPKIRMQVLGRLAVFKNLQVEHLHLAGVNPHTGKVDFVGAGLDAHTGGWQIAGGGL